MAKKKQAATPEAPAIIMQLAGVKDWEIGPTKNSECTLTLTVTVNGFADVATMTKLAKGLVIVHILPLTARLDDVLAGDECPHVSTMQFGENRAVCLVCGLMLDTPQDDQKTPTGEAGTPMVLFCGVHPNQALDTEGSCIFCEPKDEDTE